MFECRSALRRRHQRRRRARETGAPPRWRAGRTRAPCSWRSRPRSGWREHGHVGIPSSELRLRTIRGMENGKSGLHGDSERGNPGGDHRVTGDHETVYRGHAPLAARGKIRGPRPPRRSERRPPRRRFARKCADTATPKAIHQAGPPRTRRTRVSLAWSAVHGRGLSEIRLGRSALWSNGKRCIQAAVMRSGLLNEGGILRRVRALRGPGPSVP